MKIRRVVWTVALAWCSGLAAAQGSDVRGMLVPTPPFEVTSPASLSPDDLTSLDRPTTIRNLTAQPLQVTVSRTLRQQNRVVLGTEANTVHTIAAWSTLEIASGTAQTAQRVKPFVQKDATRALSLDLRVLRGSFTAHTSIPVAYPTAASAVTRLTEWNVTRTGQTLSNAVVPIEQVKTMSCQDAVVGWVKGEGGALQVTAKPELTTAGSASAGSPAPCAPTTSAAKVSAVRLSLQAWPSGEPRTGEYTGTLTLPVKGNAGTFLKLTVRNTWPWWLATLCVLAGVLTGLVWRWLSDNFTVFQQDRAAAADALLNAQQKAAELQREPVGRSLHAPFSKAAKSEHDAIIRELRWTWGLTREPVHAAALAQRLSAFRDAPDEYDKLVTALESLNTGTSSGKNRLETQIADLLLPQSERQLSISTLRETRAVVELYCSLRPVWAAFEKAHGATFAGLQQTREHFLSVVGRVSAGAYGSLVPSIASDLRDSDVALDLARDLLDTTEPTLVVAAEIRTALTQAGQALRGAAATLSLFPSGLRPAHADQSESTELTSPQVAIPVAPAATAEANARRQHVLLGWSNAGLTLLSLALVLLIGLNSLYWGKAFGPAEAWQAFAWGLGTKLGLDSLYSLVDRLMQPTPGRRITPTS